MMHRSYWMLLLFPVAMLWGCQGTRHLPANEKLYAGARVTVDGADVTVRQKKAIRSSLKGLTRPKPNTVFLGMRPKLAIYNMFRKAKKGIFKSIRDKYGEPPVLSSQLDLAANKKLLENYLVNKGWF